MPRPRAALKLALLALALPGCTGGDDSSCGTTSRLGRPLTTLQINNGAEPETLDPSLAHDNNSYTLLFQLFEGLTTYHPRDLHPTQGAAERWDRSADGLVYRFHLRPDARWSDGQPVTAADFVYAWKRVLRPATASQAAPMLYPLLHAELFHLGRLKAARRAIALRQAPRDDAAVVATLEAGAAVRIIDPDPRPGGWVNVARLARLPAPGPSGFARAEDLAEDDSPLGVRAVDDRTLDVELERPTPYFLDLTGFPNLAPLRRDVIEAAEQRGEGDLWTRPERMVVNGPYMLESWRFRDAITMKPNPFHRSREKLRTERVVWLEVESSFASMNLYKSGELDLFGDNVSIPLPYLPTLEHKRDFHQAPALAIYWYQLNVRRPPLDDVRVRRALDLAVDKGLLTARVLRSGLPATHYVPDATGSGYAAQAEADRAAGVDPFPGGGFDPERARALLREAGYTLEQAPDGLHAAGFPRVEILTNNSEGSREIAVAIQAMWRSHLGVVASLRSEEWKVMLEDRRAGRFQIVGSSFSADYNHPDTFLTPFLSSSPQNPTGWHSRAFDDALREAAAAPDPADSIRRYRRAEQIAVEGMARIPLYFFTGMSLEKPYVRGWYENPRNVHLAQFAWIDPDFRRGGEDRPAFAPLELLPPGLLDAACSPRSTGAW